MGSPMVVTLGQQYNVGEKPTVILYTYVMQGHQTNLNKNIVAHTTTKTNQKQGSTSLDRIVITYDDSAIAPYINRD